MQDDLDGALARLAAAPVHIRLADLDDIVLSRVASDAREARRGAGVGAVATVGALVMGIAASVTIASPATTPISPLSPFGASASLAPSTLLDSTR